MKAVSPLPQPAPTGNHRLKLLALLIIFMAPVIASYIAFYGGLKRPTMNYGELITPAELVPDTLLRAADGKAVSLRAVQGKWLLMTVDSGDCGAACQTKLRTMRQVRLATLKEQDRVDRALVVDDGRTLREELRGELEGMHVFDAAGTAMPAHLPGGERVREFIYLIDPVGHIVLRYPHDADPSRMLKDLMRLLKVSSIG